MSHGAFPEKQGLYDPRNEHDACGVRFVAHIKGEQSHAIVRQGLQVLENLTHRGAVGADPLAGDGAGILIQIPDRFLRETCAALQLELPAPGTYAVGMLFLPSQQQTGGEQAQTQHPQQGRPAEAEGGGAGVGRQKMGRDQCHLGHHPPFAMAVVEQTTPAEPPGLEALRQRPVHTLRC